MESSCSKKLYKEMADAERFGGMCVRETWDTAMEFCRMVWMSLEMLFEGDVSVKELSGPVGIARRDAKAVVGGVDDSVVRAAAE